MLPDLRKAPSHSALEGALAAGTGTAIPGCREAFGGARAPLQNVGGGRYGAGMPNQPDPGDSPPPPAGRKPRDRKQPAGVPTPHDAVFRRIFAVPANAASQLRAVLPPARGAGPAQRRRGVHRDADVH